MNNICVVLLDHSFMCKLMAFACVNNLYCVMWQIYRHLLGYFSRSLRRWSCTGEWRLVYLLVIVLAVHSLQYQNVCDKLIFILGCSIRYVNNCAVSVMVQNLSLYATFLVFPTVWYLLFNYLITVVLLTDCGICYNLLLQLPLTLLT